MSPLCCAEWLLVNHSRLFTRVIHFLVMRKKFWNTRSLHIVFGIQGCATYTWSYVYVYFSLLSQIIYVHYMFFVLCRNI